MASMGEKGDTSKLSNSRAAALDKTDHSVSFEISFHNDHNRPRSAPPKRLSNRQRREITKEDIDKKQQEAEARRKENEREMIDRIIQKREECRKLNENFEVLLAQDAKLQGQVDTSSIPSLPREELVKKYRAVKRDYGRMATNISRTVAHQAVTAGVSTQ